MTEEEAQAIVAQILNLPSGKSHLAANPRHPTDNRPDPPEGPGDGGTEAVVAVAEVET